MRLPSELLTSLCKHAELSKPDTQYRLGIYRLGLQFINSLDNVYAKCERGWNY